MKNITIYFDAEYHVHHGPSGVDYIYNDIVSLAMDLLVLYKSKSVQFSMQNCIDQDQICKTLKTDHIVQGDDLAHFIELDYDFNLLDVPPGKHTKPLFDVLKYVASSEFPVFGQDKRNRKHIRGGYFNVL